MFVSNYCTEISNFEKGTSYKYRVSNNTLIKINQFSIFRMLINIKIQYNSKLIFRM